MSAVDVTMAANAAAILFLLPAFIDFCLPFEKSPMRGDTSDARMRNCCTQPVAIPEIVPE
ncbi:hypothetical protein ACIBU0_33880 [Streptomyces sp. NPDC049627]|uniref:hypothetical protein n=1 Tax=Streptomyces sp. NPDC049627 TaxID=3365595 RepID=UPI0037A77045